MDLRTTSRRFAKGWLYTTMALIAMSCATGCQALPSWEKMTKDLPFIGSDDEENQHPSLEGVNPPEKLVALWSHTVFNEMGKGATRGLAGRIYFYDATHRPVPVSGQLVVYAYNDTSPETNDYRAPQRKFVFSKEEFAKHYSESEFGPSYSVWLPWDAAGGEHLELSVVPVLTSESGQVVMGEHSQHILPGQKDSLARAREQDAGRPSRNYAQVGYEAPAEPRAQPTTIAVPESVRQRLIRSSDQVDTPPNSVRIEHGQVGTWPEQPAPPSGSANRGSHPAGATTNAATAAESTATAPPAAGAASASPTAQSTTSVRYGPSRYPVRVAPFAPAGDVRTRSSPFPVGSPFALPQTAGLMQPN